MIHLAFSHGTPPLEDVSDKRTNRIEKYRNTISDYSFDWAIGRCGTEIEDPMGI
jgi:hypothetical protein